MTAAEWRALVGAYVEGRIGADAFRRRFLEAFEFAARRGAFVPGPIQELFFVVEAYAGDPMGRGHAVSDDADLARAAQAALAALGEAAPSEAPPRPAPIRVIVSGPGAGEARAQARRLGWSVGTVGALGCAAALGYLVIGVLQFFAAAAQIQSVTAFGPAPSTLIGLLLAFIPVVGSVIAFFGAKDVWNWHWAIAALAFLAAPALTYLGGWMGWRRR